LKLQAPALLYNYGFLRWSIWCDINQYWSIRSRGQHWFFWSGQYQKQHI